MLDLPLVVAGPLIVVVTCALGVGGLLVVRRLVLPRLRFTAEDAVFSSTMLLAIMVFYGLIVALIAISAWERHSEASSTVSEEATWLAVLYRNVSNYPEPIRTELQGALRGFS